jgi:hypothetical protein
MHSETPAHYAQVTAVTKVKCEGNCIIKVLQQSNPVGGQILFGSRNQPVS